MYSFEGVAALLNDDSNQMNHGITALHALIQTGACQHVASNQLNPALSELVTFYWLTHQRADRVSLIEQAPQHVLPNKAGSTGEEDAHERDCKCLFLQSRTLRFLRRRDPLPSKNVSSSSAE